MDVIMIAKDTGWSADYIMDLPYFQVWDYKLAIALSHGAECRRIITEQDKTNILETINQLKNLDG